MFVDRADDFIAWVAPDGRLVYGNLAICRALGYSKAEFSALYMWDISPRTQESWPERWAEVKQKVSENLVAELQTRGGAVLPARIGVHYAAFDGYEFLICHGRDLCAQKTRPETLARIAEPYALGSAIDAIFLLHGGVLAQDSSPGSSVREKIREDLEIMLRESGTIRERIARALAGEEVTFNWYSTRSATRVNIECTLSRIEIEGHVRLVAVATDVTARRTSERTLAQLSGRLLEAQDEERRRIARELHDTTGQNLGALSINLSMILAAGVDPRAKQVLEESIALVDCCTREIRTMSYLLHPPLLDELGLASALRAYSEGYSERTGIALELDLPPHLPRLPQAIEIALFRIVQEGLLNIHRHSGASRATLRIKDEHDRVQLELIDYGRGLPPGTLEWDVTSASRIGVGIAGMRERARQLGGRLTIASSETGTTLNVVLPLSQAQYLNTPVGSS
jgi:signal transduction histidine kinase